MTARRSGPSRRRSRRCGRDGSHLIVVCASCGSGASTASPDTTVDEHDGSRRELVALDPTTTATGTSGFGDHLVGAPTHDGRGELPFFFPGTGAHPDD